MAKIKCPAWGCGSSNVIPVGADKSFKAGKAIVNGLLGAALINPVGAIAGVATGFNGKKKVKFVCGQCGKVFEVKM